MKNADTGKVPLVLSFLPWRLTEIFSLGRSRRFGFVTYSDPGNVDAVLASSPHSLDGRTIDPKACNPRSMQKPKRTNLLPKVFLGGLPSSITETDLRSFFSSYGEVCEVVIMYDQEKKKSRGFGFLSFADEPSCARAVADHYVTIQNKKVTRNTMFFRSINFAIFYHSLGPLTYFRLKSKERNPGQIMGLAMATTGWPVTELIR